MNCTRCNQYSPGFLIIVESIAGPERICGACFLKVIVDDITTRGDYANAVPSLVELLDRYGV